jgi:hypothetical protein
MANINISAWADRTGQQLGEASKGIKLSLFRLIITDTRFDTGRLKGNWQTSVGTPAVGTIERLDDELGSAAILEAASTVTEFGVDYLTNNLPYAKKWDDVDGVVDKSIARLERNIQEVVNELT